MSRQMRNLGLANSRTQKNLDRELSHIETERKNKMRELKQATNHFLEIKIRGSSARSRDCSPDKYSTSSLGTICSNRDRPISRSPSPNPRCPLDDLFPLSRCRSPRTQKIVYNKSSSADESSTSPKLLSPNSSPEYQRRMLPKRRGSNTKLQKSQSVTDTRVTHVAYRSLPVDGVENVAHKVTVPNESTSPIPTRKQAHPSNGGIPQIIVSDTTPKLPEIRPVVKSSPERSVPKDSPRRDSSPKTPIGVTNGSLHVPVRRSRSNSAPNIIPTSHLLALVKRESTFTTAEDHENDAITIRPRSNTVCAPYFDHLKQAPRRDSLLKKYVAKPKIFHRTSKTIDQLISDLEKGIYHGELDDHNGSYKTISPEEWEKLKLCRYLRMPSKDEDVKGNTLDVDAIFPKTTDDV